MSHTCQQNQLKSSTKNKKCLFSPLETSLKTSFPFNFSIIICLLQLPLSQSSSPTGRFSWVYPRWFVKHKSMIFQKKKTFHISPVKPWLNKTLQSHYLYSNILQRYSLFFQLQVGVLIVSFKFSPVSFEDE